MASEKRIPNGTKVKWQTRYTTDPVHEGVVTAYGFPAPGLPAIYEVTVPANKPSRRLMTPLASILEGQNPTKLKRVK